MDLTAVPYFMLFIQLSQRNLLFLQSLSRNRNALLITEMDLNMCRQVKDQTGTEVRNKKGSIKEVTKDNS